MSSSIQSSSAVPSARRKYVKSGAFANRYTKGKGKDSKYIPVAQQRAAAAAAAATAAAATAAAAAPVQVEQVMAYPNQIAAANKIISTFNEECRWAVLLAFPQSGKTQTFYYVACHVLCNNPRIAHVKIICGNAERELSEQLRASKTEFIRLYVQNEVRGHPVMMEETIRHLESNIEVLCGADLTRSAPHPQIARNTLFIWEEAHCAQDKTNRPHKYFQGQRITADADVSNLEGERNNYVLTVSATPFSELSNYHHHGQSKRIVRLEPAQGYKGPRQFLESGAIVQFDPRLSQAEVVAQAIAEAPITEAHKYAIVRVRDSNGSDNMSDCIRTAHQFGWAHRVYDSDTKYTQPGSMQSMDELAVAPDCNTVIFIRGMCRMGKRVPKDHISFVVETSKGSKTDTVLQALLGRMFGYHDNMQIRVYISRKVKLSDIQSYVDMMEADDDELLIMPRTGKNLIAGPNQCVNGWYYNVPVVIRHRHNNAEAEAMDHNADEYDRELAIQAIQAAFESGDAENHNDCAEQTAEIREQVTRLTAEPHRMNHMYLVNRATGRLNVTYRDVPEKVRESIDDRVPMTPNSPGCGFESNEVDGLQINVWRCNTNQYSQSHGFHRGDLIMHTRTRVSSPQQQLHVRIPHTTGLETFSTQQEDGTVVVGNGGYSIPLAVETSYNAILMQTNLCDLIRTSQIEDSLERPKCVTSNHGVINGVSEWKGIIVTLEIMQALQRGGAIYEYVKREHGVTLKITKVLGRELKALKNSGNARLTKIEWINDANDA
jgi:hypothetical protein